MVLYIIGLGLGGEKDITVRGLEAVRRSAEVLLEHYGPLVGADKDKLAVFYGKDVVLADHSLPATVYDTAKEEDVSLLVVGDPCRGNALSHADVIVRAKELGVEVEVIHNASAMDAIGPCGLKGDTFGQAVELRPWDENGEPDDFYDKVRANRENGLHTLCSLQVLVDDFENAPSGEVSSSPPRHLSVGTALQQLLQVEERKGGGAYGPDTQCVGLAQLGQPTRQMVAGTMSELVRVGFGEFHVYFLVICGTTDAEEDKLLHCYRVATDSTKQSTEEQPPAAGEGDAEAAATEATDPDDVRDASLFNCPDAHGLFAFTTSTRTWTCSVCLGSIPAGSRAFGCRRCNYDVCSSCGLSPDGGIKVVESGPVNCPGQHGFALFTAPNSFFCDVCLGPIPAGARAYGCRQCDNDVCTSCSMGSAAFGVSGDAPIEGGALVEASQEDAAYNRAVIEDRAREAQQAQQERMRLEQHRIEMMSIASAGATIARFQHL